MMIIPAHKERRLILSHIDRHERNPKPGIAPLVVAAFQMVTLKGRGESRD